MRIYIKINKYYFSKVALNTDYLKSDKMRCDLCSWFIIILTDMI